MCATSVAPGTGHKPNTALHPQSTGKPKVDGSKWADSRYLKRGTHVKKQASTTSKSSTNRWRISMRPKSANHRLIAQLEIDCFANYETAKRRSPTRQADAMATQRAAPQPCPNQSAAQLIADRGLTRIKSSSHTERPCQDACWQICNTQNRGFGVNATATMAPRRGTWWSINKPAFLSDRRSKAHALMPFSSSAPTLCPPLPCLFLAPLPHLPPGQLPATPAPNQLRLFKHGGKEQVKITALLFCVVRDCSLPMILLMPDLRWVDGWLVHCLPLASSKRSYS